MASFEFTTIKPTHERNASKHPIFRIWKGMIYRCYDTQDDAYDRYGGRNIQICERWFVFEHFVADIGERPHKHSIERRDNNGHYSPENCYWATPKEQANNRRSNVLITIDGRTQNVSQWAKEYDIKPHRIFFRLRLGWTQYDAITTPLLGKGKWHKPPKPRSYEPIKRTSRLLTYNGRTQTVTQWAKEKHIQAITLTNRLNSGWPVADALNQPLLTPKYRKVKAF